MISEGLKQRIPWQAKIAAKIILSRLPFGYSLWQRLNLFRLGFMDDPARAIEVFDFHSGAAGDPLPSDFTVLELGPGDAVTTALTAFAAGASKTYLVDEGDFAQKDIEPYHALARVLQERGADMSRVLQATTFDDMLAACNAVYLTQGLVSLRTIPPASIDFEMSQAVLEHVRRGEFVAVMSQLRRLMAPNGFASHRIDLQDHLANALNNLRFSDRIWETGFMAKSGFYTNRIRFFEMVDIFDEVGFTTCVTGVRQFPELPTPPSKFAPQFKDVPVDDLMVCDFDVVLRPGSETV